MQSKKPLKNRNLMLSVQVQVPVGNLNLSNIVLTEVDGNPIFKALEIGSVKT